MQSSVRILILTTIIAAGAAMAQAQFKGDNYFTLGLDLARVGRYDEAIAYMTRAIEADSRNADAWGERGLLYMFKKEYRKAIADLTMAINKSAAARQAGRPETFIDYANRASAHLHLGEYELALADADTAIRVNPSGPNGWNSKAVILATSPDAKYRDGKKAFECASKAFQLNRFKEDKSVYEDTLAAAYAELSDFPHAIQYAEMAIKDSTDPNEQTEMRQQLALYRDKKPNRITIVKE